MNSGKNFSPFKGPVTRREFLGGSAIAAAGACIYGFSMSSGNAQATTAARRRPFVIHIHMGAWEGYSAGLMMPTDHGIYPNGVFFSNQTVGHPNPNVNVHYKSGNLVFNDYTKVLLPIANHMMFAVATPQSLSHDQAYLIQQTGSRLEGASRSPSWAAGFAQATGGNASGSYVLLDGGGRGVDMLAKTTPGVTTITAATIDEAKNMYSDPDTIPRTPEADKYAAIGKNAYAIDYNLSALLPHEKQGAGISIDALRRGIPDVQRTQELISAFMTTSGLDEKFADIPDKEAVVRVNEDGNLLPQGNSSRGLASLHGKLKLAALLIETQAASGIHINMPNIHDYHGGGAHVLTARAASRVWGQIAQFWEWVVSKGYQDDVLVIVGNEFNRTAANGTKVTIAGVTVRDGSTVKAVTVDSPGTDHHLSCGLVFINGKVPQASRLGYIGDTFVPTGGKLNQGPAVGVAPFTSLQLVTSVFMRSFPSIFSDYRAVREIWQPIKENDIIADLLR